MAVTKNLVIDQGSDFYLEMTATDQRGNVINIHGATGYSQFRGSYLSSSYIDMITGISNGTAGIFSVSLSAAVSASADSGNYVWDARFVWNDGSIKRVKQGNLRIDPSVTR